MFYFHSDLIVLLIIYPKSVPGYKAGTKIGPKKIKHVEFIPANLAINFGVTPEEAAPLFKNHEQLIAVHF